MSSSNDRLLRFLSRSPTPFHAVANIRSRLETAGFTELLESQSWASSRLNSGKYYVTRNDSSLIAFKISTPPEETGFRLVGAHTDSPCLKVKPNAITVNNGYAKLALEVYGGALLGPWFDRDLGLAGRITVRTQSGNIENYLVNFDHPIAFIPNLAIHLDRKANEEKSINKQKHLPAVLCRCDGDNPSFDGLLRAQLLKEQPGLDVDEILSFEMSLYDCQAAALVGLHEEFIASARLDNLLSCHGGVEAIINSSDNTNQILVLNDHEEVGSSSTSGAEGPFLLSIIHRLCAGEENTQRAISHSMMISADNAHGVHPNYADLHEPEHQPLINNGPVIKLNSNQRYATNSETEAMFKHICQTHNLPYQVVVVRSDMGCGSTIGPITATRLGVRTIDIGVPQLGMHSIRELAGAEDQQILVRALTGFYSVEKWPF
ncbi:MAG: M18 family aminopeptidase [Gammaproteobacteria bacterium]|nr:M18 family aminopeptidase [Gammaproteobacteria bacterium]